MATIFDQAEFFPDGRIQLRFIMDDGTYLRTAVEPGKDLNRQMSRVADHLSRKGRAPIADTGKIHAAVAAAAQANDGRTTLVVNVNKRLIGRRGIPNATTYNVKTRGAFLADQQNGRAIHDLVFTPEVIAADEAGQTEVESS